MKFRIRHSGGYEGIEPALGKIFDGTRRDGYIEFYGKQLNDAGCKGFMPHITYPFSEENMDVFQVKPVRIIVNDTREYEPGLEPIIGRLIQAYTNSGVLYTVMPDDLKNAGADLTAFVHDGITPAVEFLAEEVTVV